MHELVINRVFNMRITAHHRPILKRLWGHPIHCQLHSHYIDTWLSKTRVLFIFIHPGILYTYISRETDVSIVTSVSRRTFCRIQGFSCHETDVKTSTSVSRQTIRMSIDYYILSVVCLWGRSRMSYNVVSITNYQSFSNGLRFNLTPLLLSIISSLPL